MKPSLPVSFAIAILAGAALTARADPTFTGSSSGVFSDPSGGPDNPTPVYTITGNSVSFGEANPDANVLTFDSAGFSSVAPDQIFTVGSLYYYNGNYPDN